MSKKTPINDPLESAKVGKDAPKKSGWGRGKSKAKATAVEEAVVETSAPAPAATPEPVAPPPVPVAVAPTGPKPTPPQKFKVLKTQRISRNGQITSLKKDSIVSSQHYGGMPGIEELRASGVELEKLEG